MRACGSWKVWGNLYGNLYSSILATQSQSDITVFELRSALVDMPASPWGHVLQEVENHPMLCSLTLEDINLFIRLAAQLKRDIQLPLPLHQSNPECPPDILPLTVEQFLSCTVGIPRSSTDDLWDILKDHAWGASPQPFFEGDLTLFKEHGWALLDGWFIIHTSCQLCSHCLS